MNPVVPVQLIVDHSLAVECGGFDPQAFEKNRAIEDRRNEDRFHFIDWTKQAFKNIEVILPGNGIMHPDQPGEDVPCHPRRSRFWPTRIPASAPTATPPRGCPRRHRGGVGGLEAENVMLGRASWMRLPSIVGVELSGKPQPGITATDLVLSLTEFLRQQKVVGAYLEFRGEGPPPSPSAIGHHLQHGAGYGATAAMFFIDQQTIDYLKLTGRDDEQVRLVETYARRPVSGPMPWRALSSTSGCCTLTCRAWVRTLAAPPTPIAACRYRHWPSGESRWTWTRLVPRRLTASLPDGAVIIAAITSCTNTSNPRNVIAAGLLARNANRLGLMRKPWVKSSLAPGSKTDSRPLL